VSAASFTATSSAGANGAFLITVSSSRERSVGGDALAGNACVPAGTIVDFQVSGKPGRGGVYITNQSTSCAAASLTTMPAMIAYQVSGGRGKRLSGLAVKMRYPSQEIDIQSNMCCRTLADEIVSAPVSVTTASIRRY
jgi:hypothetical protein